MINQNAVMPVSQVSGKTRAGHLPCFVVIMFIMTTQCDLAGYLVRAVEEVHGDAEGK